MGDAREEIASLVRAAQSEGSNVSLSDEQRMYSRGVARGLEKAAKLLASDSHPLVALLAEALAVTDMERPPHEVQLCLDGCADDGVLLVWHHEGCGDTTIEYLPTGRRWRSLYGRPPLLSTSDPAEARAWLAAALEAT